MEKKHTPGVWEFYEQQERPFDLQIKVGDKVIAVERRVVSASWHKTIDDLRNACGFRDDREEVIEAIETQVADMRLKAAAPDLLEALEGLLRQVEFGAKIRGGYGHFSESAELARAAIRKAYGEGV